MRVVVTGSSGLIGESLVAVLRDRGDEVLRMVRRSPGGGEAFWDPRSRRIDRAAIAGCDAVVHLAGVGIGDRRWTEMRKRDIFDSRVESTRLIAETIAGQSTRPAVLVSASAVGIYGSRGGEVLTEQSAPGTGFAAQVCKAWEAETAAAESAGIRVVHLRSGVVLSEHGGALARQLPLFRLGLGGKLGPGDQWLSWITLRDEISAIVHLLEDDSVSGPVNSTTPAPVTNAIFTKALGRALRRPAIARVPRAALSLALGPELARELLLTSQRALPARLEAAEFEFLDPSLDEALGALLGR